MRVKNLPSGAAGKKFYLKKIGRFFDDGNQNGKI